MNKNYASVLLMVCLSISLAASRAFAATGTELEAATVALERLMLESKVSVRADSTLAKLGFGAEEIRLARLSPVNAARMILEQNSAERADPELRALAKKIALQSLILKATNEKIPDHQIAEERHSREKFKLAYPTRDRELDGISPYTREAIKRIFGLYRDDQIENAVKSYIANSEYLPSADIRALAKLVTLPKRNVILNYAVVHASDLTAANAVQIGKAFLQSPSSNTEYKSLDSFLMNAVGQVTDLNMDNLASLSDLATHPEAQEAIHAQGVRLLMVRGTEHASPSDYPRVSPVNDQE